MKPLEIEADFNPAEVEGFIIRRDGLYQVPKAGAESASTSIYYGFDETNGSIIDLYD